MKISILCPAKINSFLNITAKEKPLHSLKMINQSVSLYDYIELETNNDNSINLVCNNSLVPCDESNSIYKAILILKEKYNINHGFNIFINKQIPLSSGLGGESTDAAGTILAINELFNLKLMKNDLKEIGFKIGSDVPFCLEGGTKIIESFGQVIKKRKTEYNYFLIVNPNVTINTKEMFEKYDYSINKYIKIKNNKYGHNDFEKVIPNNLLKIKDDLISNGAIFSNLTGSGSCFIGAFDNFLSQKKAYLALKDKYEIYIVTSCDGIKIIKKKYVTIVTHFFLIFQLKNN